MAVKAVAQPVRHTPDTNCFLRLKPKAGDIPEGVQYFSAVDTPDVWLAYPWECETDIDEHDALRSENPVL